MISYQLGIEARSFYWFLPLCIKLSRTFYSVDYYFFLRRIMKFGIVKCYGMALVLFHGYAGQAAVTFEKQKNEKSLLTFSGIDLNRFHVIDQILSSENSPIASKFFFNMPHKL